MTEIIGVASLAVWIYLLLGRGGFWRIRESPAPETDSSASVAVIIPARDEAATVGQAIASLKTRIFEAR